MAQQAERYRLVVSGIVTYTPEDYALRDFLMSHETDKGKLDEALQELEEQSIDVKVSLERIS